TLDQHGLNSKQLKLAEPAIRKIIQEYTREAGVRNLERSLATICRKVAMQIVKGEESNVKIVPQNLVKYLGPPRVVREDEISPIPQVGIVNGLAWTETGGELLQIE